MTYAAAIEHLYALGQELAPPPGGQPRRKFDLAYMRVLMEALGDPQDEVPSVLIAGTNGKGSTASTLASILTTAGYRTALYTSPHLSRVNERIQLAHPVLPSEYGTIAAHGADGPLALGAIADDDFARIYLRIDKTAQQLVETGALPHPPSFFEVLTALAFCYFAEQRAEIAVLEVGLGGRLDATNIVEPLFAVITDISLDHQEYLGNTIAEIAREKCGILREQGTLITLPQHPEANQAIGEAAMSLNVRGVDAARYLPPAVRNGERPDPPVQPVILSGAKAPRISPEAAPDPNGLSPNRYTLNLEDPAHPELLEVDSPLTGQHQQRNLALAIAAAVELRNQNGYNITNAALSRGIRNTSWPGRLELIRHAGSPDLLLDVAHNPAGAWTLRAALAQLPEDRPRTLIFSCLKDKSLQEMSRILFPLFDSSFAQGNGGGDPLRRYDHILLAPIGNPRAAAVEDLLAAAHALEVPAHAAPHLAGALNQARAITPAGGLIVATGSVYLVGEIRHLALEPTLHPTQEHA
ncbi:dihydrofolate synthase / folylpolyglutamate synthase [Granulicella rosea]|uniref:Dihydrofolate synthase/folylpolyglutamate synthase n=1 Tax=Granulicella rosea TaxID=474952 RepID=A0A239DP94_9BACT|nr:folylpolyglutamate synthase/dihydrofolate synthase family protein [Granulicella rosea]SNS34147.1 dihydrofolate synthase / folylpolyglutamate synthase [Granulicella rosea]